MLDSRVQFMCENMDEFNQHLSSRVRHYFDAHCELKGYDSYHYPEIDYDCSSFDSNIIIKVMYREACGGDSYEDDMSMPVDMLWRVDFEECMDKLVEEGRIKKEKLEAEKLATEAEAIKVKELTELNRLMKKHPDHVSI